VYRRRDVGESAARRLAPSAAALLGDGASMLQGSSVISIHVEWKIEDMLEAGAYARARNVLYQRRRSLIHGNINLQTVRDCQ